MKATNIPPGLVSYEVRRVTKDWEHPTDESGSYTPLFDGWLQRCRDRDLWEKGEHPFQKEHQEGKFSRWTFVDYEGDYKKEDYMLADVPDPLRTHFQLYETNTEGTPATPVFASLSGLSHYAQITIGTPRCLDAFEEIRKSLQAS